MEEKKYPSLPSNYVTLVQLQERWIKQQQKKQIEKERQEQEEEEQRREEQRLKNEQDKQKHIGNEEKPETHSKSINRRRNSRPYNRRTNAGRHLEPEGPEAQSQTEAEALVVVGEEIHEQDRNSDELKKKKKKKKQWYVTRKPKREEEVTGGAEPPAPENVEEENILVRRDGYEEENVLARRDDERKGLHGGLNISVRRDGERKGMRGEFQYKIKTVAKGKVSEPDDHLTVEIGRQFEGLSMNRGKEEGKYRSTIERNGGPWRYRGSGRFSLRGGEIWKPRDSGLVWVKKGEISNGNVPEIQYPQENRWRN